jgi:neutral ceramidase
MIRMFVFGIVTLNAALHAATGLSAGAATVDITPPIGAAMAGYFSNRAATATHDPLLARALVFEHNGTRIALVTCDLTNMPEGIATEARRLVSHSTGIPASHVMISATHAHSAPVLLSGWTRYVLEGQMKQIADAYAAALPGRIAASVQLAVAKLRPARIFAGSGEEKTLAFHRRYLMKDGTVAWNPGKRNPNIVAPAGPIDPAVPLVYVEGEDGLGIALYVNYAMHLDTVGGTEFSADLVYALTEAMRVARGSAMVTLFSMGCAGNINHVDTSSSRKQGGHREAARIGTTLAAAALKAMDELVEVKDYHLGANSQITQLAAIVPTKSDLEEAHAAKPQSGNTQLLARASRTLEIESRNGRPFTAEVQALQLSSDLVWVGLPGEIFVELGLDLKARATSRWTIIATQTNAALGYIPHSAAYPQGNYEVVSSRVQSGSGEALVAAALKAIAAIQSSGR